MRNIPIKPINVACYESEWKYFIHFADRPSPLQWCILCAALRTPFYFKDARIKKKGARRSLLFRFIPAHSCFNFPSKFTLRSQCNLCRVPCSRTLGILWSCKSFQRKTVKLFGISCDQNAWKRKLVQIICSSIPAMKHLYKLHSCYLHTLHSFLPCFPQTYYITPQIR